MRMVWVGMAALLALLLPLADARPSPPDAAIAAPTAALNTHHLGSTADRPRKELVLRIDAARAARKTGIVVVDLRSGRTVYEHAADTIVEGPLATALVTSAAALALLGPAHRFRTSLWSDGWGGKDTIHGNLYVRGAGDPTLDTSMLWKLASELHGKGIKTITGSIIVEESWRDTRRTPIRSAASLHYNSVAVHVKPGQHTGEPVRAMVWPPSDLFRLTISAITVMRMAPPLALEMRGATDPHAKPELVLTGALALGTPPQTMQQPIDEPGRLLGAVLRDDLYRLGIRLETPGVTLGAVPASARSLAWHDSAPLSVLAKRLYDDSDAFVGDHVLAALVPRGAGPADGKKAVEDWLANLGIPVGTYRFASGANDRFSAEQLVRLLVHAYRDFRYSSDFVALLPVVRGTVRATVQLTGTQRNLLGVIPGQTPVAIAIVTGDTHEAAESLERDVLDAVLSYVMIP